MATINQGISVKEIERVIAQRVVTAIEAIAIYEMKTNMARKLMSQTEQQEYKVAKNASNKRKWEGASCTTMGNAKNKRKLNNTSNNNQNQQQPNRRKNTGEAYTTRHGEKKHYGESKPLCSKCKYHHDGPCAPKCYKCNRVGHLACDCRSSTNANAVNNQRVTGASQKATCYECGNQGYYRSDCPERKNQNYENQTRGTEARGMVHA
ncbi:putative reverse transcriptase domain-containing protein [Tanacetum coccineum]